MGLSVHYALVVLLTPKATMQLLAKEGVMLYFAITILAESFHTAHLSVQVEAGARLSAILVQDWDRGKPAAFDISVVSPLKSNVLSAAGARAGAASEAAELRKHTANDAKCAELGWVSIPLVAESYGAWGKEAQQSFPKLASRLAVHGCVPKSKATFEPYARLNIS